MRVGALLGIGSTLLPASVVLIGWSSGLTVLPMTIELSGHVSDWWLVEEWTGFSSLLAGVPLLTGVVFGPLHTVAPIAMAERIPWSDYWRSTPEREDRLRELLRSSFWAAMVWMNAVLAGFLGLTVVAAVLGVSSLGYAVPVLVGVGGTMSVALLAFDLLVRYRPPEET